MGYTIVVDDEHHAGPNITGWKRLREWAESLDSRYDALAAFFRENISESPSDLKSDLEHALKHHSPADAAVEVSVRELANAITHDASIVYVSDGFTDADVEDDWCTMDYTEDGENAEEDDAADQDQVR